jgi:hypothetical protein
MLARSFKTAHTGFIRPDKYHPGVDPALFAGIYYSLQIGSAT